MSELRVTWREAAYVLFDFFCVCCPRLWFARRYFIFPDNSRWATPGNNVQLYIILRVAALHYCIGCQVHVFVCVGPCRSW